jgi:hypothetical protein
MKRLLSIRKSPQKLIGLVVILYGAYLLKTAMGINLSSNHSASWVLKVPLQPLWANKAALCEEFQTLCTVRNSLQHKIRHRIERLKGAV